MFRPRHTALLAGVVTILALGGTGVAIAASGGGSNSSGAATTATTKTTSTTPSSSSHCDHDNASSSGT